MLTDNEIKKFLKWCEAGSIMAKTITISNNEMATLCDLINRLEAENERLRESCSHIDICCKNCKYLIRYRGSAPLIAQCTKGHKDFLPFDVGDSIETYYCRGFTPFKFNTTNEAEIKAEAYKEFAEGLKNRLIKGGLYPAFVKCRINDLLKELVGDKNEQTTKL